jgi:hypothetical protein
MFREELNLNVFPKNLNYIINCNSLLAMISIFFNSEVSYLVLI